MRIGVLGAGIIGLWTAYELTERGHEVTIYSDSPVNATTSSSAVAVVTPLFPWSLEESPELFNESIGWFRSTLAKFHELNHGHDFMNLVPSYEFGYVDGGVRVLEKGFPASRLYQLNFSTVEEIDTPSPIRVENETNHFDDVTFAVHFQAEMVDTQVFLPFFEQLLRDRGVKFQHRHISKVADLELLAEETLFNCLGIFSRFLFPEVGPEMYPIRGQSHFIAHDNEPPYYGVASGHHAVFRHKRGFYLGSYFLEKSEYTWRSDRHDERESLVTMPTENAMSLTRKFATETYVELAAAMGIEAQPIDIDGPHGIWRVNTGVRPFRKQGPVCGRRLVGTKEVFDNFGHGAHGWTIGYGSTVIAIDEMEKR